MQNLSRSKLKLESEDEFEKPLQKKLKLSPNQTQNSDFFKPINPHLDDTIRSEDLKNVHQKSISQSQEQTQNFNQNQNSDFPQPQLSSKTNSQQQYTNNNTINNTNNNQIQVNSISKDSFINSVDSSDDQNESPYQIIKNDDEILIQRLDPSGQGQVDYVINKNTNEQFARKLFSDSHEFYEKEKEIYEYLQKHKNYIEEYVIVDGITFDNDQKIIKFPKADCNLFDFMYYSHKIFLQNQKKQLINPFFFCNSSNFHLSKYPSIEGQYPLIAQILFFIIEAITALEKIGIRYQDIKPQNILIRSQVIQGQLLYKFYLCDMGGAYKITPNKPEAEYGFGTPRFYKKTLREQLKKVQNTNFPVYSSQNIIEDFQNVMVQVLKACMFPGYFWNKKYSQILDSLSEEKFLKSLEDYYGFQCIFILIPGQIKYDSYFHIFDAYFSKNDIIHLKPIHFLDKTKTISKIQFQKNENQAISQKPIEYKIIFNINDNACSLFDKHFNQEALNLFQKIEYSLEWYVNLYKQIQFNEEIQELELRLFDIKLKIAEILLRQTNYNKSIQVLDKLKEQLKRDKNPTEYMKLHILLSNSYFNLNKYQESHSNSLEAKKILKKYNIQCLKLKATILFIKAKSEYYVQNQQNSNTIFQKSLDFYSLNIEELDLEELQNLAEMYSFCQNYQESEKIYFKSEEKIKEIQGENSILHANLCSKIGLLYQQQQKYDLSLQYFRKSKNNYLKFGKTLTLEMLPVLENIAHIYKLMKMQQNSIEEYQEILTIQKFQRISIENTVNCIIENQQLLQFEKGKRNQQEKEELESFSSGPLKFFYPPKQQSFRSDINRIYVRKFIDSLFENRLSELRQKLGAKNLEQIASETDKNKKLTIKYSCLIEIISEEVDLLAQLGITHALSSNKILDLEREKAKQNKSFKAELSKKVSILRKKQEFYEKEFQSFKLFQQFQQFQQLQQQL